MQEKDWVSSARADARRREGGGGRKGGRTRLKLVERRLARGLGHAEVDPRLPVVPLARNDVPLALEASDELLAVGDSRATRLARLLGRVDHARNPDLVDELGVLERVALDLDGRHRGHGAEEGLGTDVGAGALEDAQVRVGVAHGRRELREHGGEAVHAGEGELGAVEEEREPVAPQRGQRSSSARPALAGLAGRRGLSSADSKRRD